jgi:hypothetical protein
MQKRFIRRKLPKQIENVGKTLYKDLLVSLREIARLNGKSGRLRFVLQTFKKIKGLIEMTPLFSSKTTELSFACPTASFPPG